MTPDVTVVIPYHPAREANGYLARAVDSALSQTVPCKVITQLDVDGRGAGPTRDAGLRRVNTPWTAFLDSDDYLLPEHVERCLAYAREHGADYVYPWFHMNGGIDPFPAFFGMPWDDAAPHSTTTTILVKTELAQRIGFGDQSGEDWAFTLRCVAAGATIVHLPERTWYWSHHGENTSGRPDRGDACGHAPGPGASPASAP